MFQGTGLHIVKGSPPAILSGNQSLTKAIIRQYTPVLRKESPLTEAMKYADAFNEPSVETFSQVGLRFGVSRVRVSQMLNLLDLDESIKEYLLNIDDPKEHNFFTERQLRPIATIKDKNEQIYRFRQLTERLNSCL